MAVLNFTGLESGDSSEAQSTTGTFSIQSSVVRSGSYALRVNPTTSATGNVRMAKHSSEGVATTAFGVSTLYHRFYFRVATAPSADEEQMYVVLDDGGSDKCYLTLNSSRNIKAYNNAGSLIGTGTTVLSTNTWYRIELKTSTGSGSQAFVVRIDGTDEFNTTANQLTNNHGSVRLGKGTNLNSRSIDFYYDDWAVSDSDWLGEGQCLRMAPDSNGSTAQWTTGTNSSNYAEVDEVPTDSDTTYLKTTASAGDVHLVGLVSCATAGVSGTINAVKAFARIRETTDVTTATRVRVRSSSTNNDTGTNNPGTSYVSRFNLLTTDPATSAAWTTSALDSVEIGVKEDNAVSTRCSTLALFVDFAPSSDATGTASVTLEDTTSAASGSLEISGTASVTLAETTSTASGTLAISGSAGATLEDTSASASGALTIAGTASVTLEDTTSAASGTVEVPEITGSASITLSDTTSAASGTLTIVGSTSVTLEDTTSAASGTLAIAGTTSVTLEDTTSAASGTLAISGTASVTLADTTLAASGTVESSEISGSASVTLEDTTSTASGSLTIAGTASVTLEDVASTASGTLTIAGSASISLADTSLAASGDVASGDVAGSASITLEDTTMAASGSLAISGSASVTLTDTTVSASGALTIAGTGSVTLDDASVSASGSPVYAGTSSVTLDDTTVSASGSLEIPGTAAISLVDTTLAASGLIEVDFEGGGDPVLVEVSQGELELLGRSRVLTLVRREVSQSVRTRPQASATAVVRSGNRWTVT